MMHNLFFQEKKTVVSKISKKIKKHHKTLFTGFCGSTWWNDVKVFGFTVCDGNSLEGLLSRPFNFLLVSLFAPVIIRQSSLTGILSCSL